MAVTVEISEHFFDGFFLVLCQCKVFYHQCVRRALRTRPNAWNLSNSLTQVYGDAGITPRFIYYPSQRGLAMVNDGTLDAEAGRLESVAKNYPNLVKVEVPLVISLYWLFFCLEPSECHMQGAKNVAWPAGFEGAQHFL